MANSPDGPFQVHKVPQVKRQILELAAKAKATGNFDSLVDALAWVVTTLENNPEDWGDPTYHTKRAGGIVYRGIHHPLVVHYAVFAAEKIVFLLDVKSLEQT